MNENLSKKFEDQAIIVFSKELVTFKETVLRENQSNLNENVKLASKTSEARINDLVSSAAKIQERLNVNSCYQSSSFTADGQGFSGTIPAENVGVVSTVLPNVVRVRSKCTEVQSDDVRGDACITHSLEVHAMCGSSNAQTVTDGGHSDGVGRSHSMHCHSSVINDVMLPKFHDSSKQNPVQFLCDLDSYFNLKHVPEVLKLPVAIRAISDSYTKQWVESVRNDIRTYDQFKQSLTDLLWSSAVQLEIRNAIYRDKYSKASGESLSQHLLRYSCKSAHLRPRMQENDLVSAIAFHYAPYVIGLYCLPM
jgi:hypothetical protein